MGRQRNRQRFSPPAGPFELEVSDLATDARGVGHRDGKAVFVADSLPGDQILYKRVRQHRNHDEGVLQSIVQPAAERVTPRCNHFGNCGGCALQHLQPDAQIEFKQTQLLNTLQRIGKVSPDQVLAPITGTVWNYRRRARLAVKYVPKKGGVLLGFRERNSPAITPLRDCDVLVKSVSQHIVALGQLIESLSIRERIPQVEVAAGDNALALVLRVLSPPTEADRNKLVQFSQDAGLWFHLQPDGLDSITPLREGTPTLYYDLPEHDVRLAFAPTDFVQIHAEVNARMVDQAISQLQLEPTDRVLELFSGIGNFTLPVARRAEQVISVEGEADLVKRAQANAGLNKIENITPLLGDLFAADARPIWSKQGYNKVLLDPPRSGAREAIAALAKQRPEKILYCSCHPATLARDAATLVHEQGYTLSSVGVMDMFAHTAHVEVMALFERK